MKNLHKQMNSVVTLNADYMTFGEVATLVPLTIKLNDLVTLPSEMLYLSQACRKFKVTIPHTHALVFNGSQVGQPMVTAATPPMSIQNGMMTEASIAGVAGAATEPPVGHFHVLDIDKIPDIETQDVTQEFVEIDLYEPLAVGDIVLLLQVAGKYLVVERVEEAE